VLAPVRRFVRFLRLTLVCLTLVWSAAPAAAAPITDGIALVAEARVRAVTASHPTAAPTARPAKTPGEAMGDRDGSPPIEGIPADRPESRPTRRLYLEHRSILC
jgi:hypothetical protein